MSRPVREFVLKGQFVSFSISPQPAKPEHVQQRREPNPDLYPPEIADRLMLAWETPPEGYDRDDVNVLQDALEHLERQYGILKQELTGAGLTEQQEATSKALGGLLEKLQPYGDSIDAILALYQRLEKSEQAYVELHEQVYGELEDGANRQHLLIQERHKLYQLLVESYRHLKAADHASPADRASRRNFMISVLSPLIIESEEIPF